MHGFHSYSVLMLDEEEKKLQKWSAVDRLNCDLSILLKCKREQGFLKACESLKAHGIIKIKEYLARHPEHPVKVPENINTSADLKPYVEINNAKHTKTPAINFSKSESKKETSHASDPSYLYQRINICFTALTEIEQELNSVKLLWEATIPLSRKAYPSM